LSNLSSSADFKFDLDKSYDYISRVTPVLLDQESGMKRIGSGQQIIEFCCL